MAPEPIVRESNTMALTRKPVIVRKFSRDWCAGYTDSTFARDGGELEILDLTGKIVRIAWDQVKWVCFVRELPGADETGGQAGPERLLHKRFTVRPRTAGVWLRTCLRDGEELEGIAANDRSLLDGAGVMLTPPDTRSNSQRVYVPRQAIETLEVVGVIGAASRKRTAGKLPQEQQPELFGDEDGV